MQLRILTVLALAAPLAAQDPDRYAVEVPYPFQSGRFDNPTDGVLLVSTEIVSDPGSPSLRVFFDEVDVPQGGYLEVTGLLDGEVHRLTQTELSKWAFSSAFFNGDKLQLDLYAGPLAPASYSVSHVLAGVGGAETICFEDDDRIPSTDNRATRMMNASGTSACSGWLAGPDDCAFGAGHCFTSFSASAQFNVPPSTAGGGLQHPPVSDQFPIDQGSRIWTNGGLGNDWGVCRLLTNNLGESAAAKYGFYELGFFTPDPGQTIRITGFGADSGSTNQTNQTHTGPYVSTIGTSIRYQVDTTGGNSGSVVILEDLDIAVGIHTNGGCSLGGGSNSGTSLLNQGLIDAWEETCSQGAPAVPVASFDVSTSAAKVGQNVFFEDTTSGFPDTWSWDLDGDGQEDSNAKVPSFAYDSPGTYTASLTASNSLGTDSATLVDVVTVTAVSSAQIPYTEDFSAGLPTGPEWVFSSTNTFGEITSAAFGDPSPGSGHPALAMAASAGGNGSTNHAVLHLDLSTVGAATLSYWAQSAGDDSDPGDGVFISDGTNSTKATNHNNLPAGWTQFEVDLFAVAAQAGLQLGADSTITFSQTDNFDLGQDGVLIDDIAIFPSLSVQGDNSVLLSTFGGTHTMTLQGGVGFAGSTYLVLGSVTGTSPGIPLGLFELPLFPDPYFFLTLRSPNQPPLVNSFGTLDAAGEAVVQFVLPPGLGLAPLTVFHSFLTLDAVIQDVTGVSNADTFLVWF